MFSALFIIIGVTIIVYLPWYAINDRIKKHKEEKKRRYFLEQCDRADAAAHLLGYKSMYDYYNYLIYQDKQKTPPQPLSTWEIRELEKILMLYKERYVDIYDSINY